MASVNEIIDLIVNSPELTIEDRVSLVRTIAGSIPDLVVPERRLKGRIDSAQAVRPEFVDTAILGLESSPLWQQSSATSPKFLRSRLDSSASFRLLREAGLALAEVADYNSRRLYFEAVEGARAALRVGKEITGDAAILVQPHLEIMNAARPSRRRPRPSTQPTTPVPPSAKE